MAARKRATTKKAGGRGSPEAIAKRRTARQLNALLEGGTKEGPKLDGRTEKRRKRLIQELKDGKRGEALKPVEAVSHTNELLGLGESLASLKRQGVKPRKFDTSPEIMDVVRATQTAYGYAEDAWKIIGITLDAPAPEKKAKRTKK
ncbi:MAG: hypothetical protein KC593_06125 [Myxococcales bacterium]|nr:hypothetical protein [Myxococcales bacterium]MCB9627286.1 hypothetical protein [Sandaracinaceae bacterium]